LRVEHARRYRILQARWKRAQSARNSFGWKRGAKPDYRCETSGCQRLGQARRARALQGIATDGGTRAQNLFAMCPAVRTAFAVPLCDRGAGNKSGPNGV
jgi:hypothetical protein